MTLLPHGIVGTQEGKVMDGFSAECVHLYKFVLKPNLQCAQSVMFQCRRLDVFIMHTSPMCRLALEQSWAR